MPILINVSRFALPKPKGTTGATKMKIMAVVCHNAECGLGSYGYNIWQALKEHFHLYLNDGDIRNVYHHLKGLCDIDLLVREEPHVMDSTKKCYYHLTEKGQNLKSRYEHYLDILQRSLGST